MPTVVYAPIDVVPDTGITPRWAARPIRTPPPRVVPAETSRVRHDVVVVNVTPGMATTCEPKVTGGQCHVLQQDAAPPTGTLRASDRWVQHRG